MKVFDKLLVLDLDETLVHARTTALVRPPDARVFEYSIYWRPQLHWFLDHVCARFREVAIWTSSGRDYADCVSQLFGGLERFAFIWASERCTRHFDRYSYEAIGLKDLKKLTRRGYHPEQVIFVDDTPEKIQRSYGNYVRVAPFTGDSDDDELAALARYLDSLGSRATIRELEKRDWRARHGLPPLRLR